MMTSTSVLSLHYHLVFLVNEIETIRVLCIFKEAINAVIRTRLLHLSLFFSRSSYSLSFVLFYFILFLFFFFISLNLVFRNKTKNTHIHHIKSRPYCSVIGEFVFLFRFFSLCSVLSSHLYQK